MFSGNTLEISMSVVWCRSTWDSGRLWLMIFSCGSKLCVKTCFFMLAKSSKSL